jgi:hypothetical protein
VIALLGLIGFVGGVKAGVSGAVFTTDNTCTKVNGNIYASKDAVYLDGGPAKSGAAGLPDGNYYVMITDPSGATILGNSFPHTIAVSGGEFAACIQLSAFVYSASLGFPTHGYDDTPNSGGEYKVWVSTDSTFPNDLTKTDNFKVRSNIAPCDTLPESCQGSGATLCLVCQADIGPVCNDSGALTATETFSYPELSDGSMAIDPHCFLPDGTEINSPYAFPIGMTTVTCTGKDSSDALGCCSFTVTVNGCGAACFPNGTCQDGLTADQAATAGGTYQGDGSTCAGPTPCAPQGSALIVTKTASGSLTRTFTWGISKSVDNTQLDVPAGTSATFNYTVSVTHDSGTDSGWTVTGKITVANPNGFDVTGVNVSDSIDDANASCSITGGGSNNGVNETIPANSSVDFTYTCTYSAAGPANASAKNTGHVSWATSGLGELPASSADSAPVSFTFTPTLVDDCVTVTDTLGGTLGKVCNTDSSPTTFTYPESFTAPSGTCQTHDNTATFTTDDTGTTGSSGQTVTVCGGADLKVSKTATPAFTRTYTWDIKKSVDKTLVEQIGGTTTFNYTVKACETSFSDSAWTVTGTITVTNPNDWEDIALTLLSDKVDDGGTCQVSSDNSVFVDSLTLTVKKSSSATIYYQCTYASAPSPASGVNTATAKWDFTAASTPDGSASGTANFSFTTPSKTVNKTVTVKDTFNGTTTTLGTVTATDATPYASQTFTYSHTVNVPANNCITYNNTAKIVETSQTASASVEVCGPAKTGALTMGFWQNKNGQGIITGQASSGTCPSAIWLRQYAPFQDLSATATCSQVATYVFNIIKAANAGGTSMNPMLKAQMLATALDVYFSDPTLGGNKISAPAPIGGVKIDLTHICAMTDSSSGGSCSGKSETASSAFGGASSLTISQMLAYAASQSNAGGITWYGNVKATQGLAKDAFDAINNGVAFSP